MPHLLIAGTTGSGKSVGINTMILSLLYRLTPDQCKFIMIDPKMLELSVYDGIPHLLAPVVTDPNKAVVALKWTVREMEERYRRCRSSACATSTATTAASASRSQGRDADPHGADRLRPRDRPAQSTSRRKWTTTPMPFIVVIVDEMADLMMVAGKDIEGAVQRLAQMARAAGIHVIMATQRPSVDVITGTIKANFPTRVRFQVTSKIDSRTILGEQGAEQLLGKGDMLYMAGGGRITRVHGPFVADEEVEKVVKHLKKQGVPDYLEAITEEESADGDEEEGEGEAYGESGDELYDQAVAVVLQGSQGLDQLRAAPARHRLQPRRDPDRAHGEGRPDRRRQSFRQARDPGRQQRGGFALLITQSIFDGRAVVVFLQTLAPEVQTTGETKPDQQTV